MAFFSKKSTEDGPYTVTQVYHQSTKHAGNDSICSVAPTGKHGQKNGSHCTDHDIPGNPVRHRAENCPLDGSENCGHKNGFFGW